MAADAGGTVAALEEARALFHEQIAAQGGRVVDMAGDSVLALFESAAGAVDAALAVQKALEAASRATAAERRLRVRIGVHLGDVIEKADGSIYGHGVNVAAHLQTKAAPGGVCMSEALYESVKERLPGAARFAGRQRLKNIEEPVALWQVLPEGASAADYALADTPNNLPLQLTSFIGRDDELARSLLQSARAAKLIASSREPLRIAGETTYAVPALPQSEAERLFVERARAAKPDFRVDGSAAALAGVCRRLDGIPLAIELAAARVRTLPVEAIAARLDDRFRLLTGGDRTALPRQQTLRALIDWSYDLLTENERALLRRLSVCAGGWTLEAAETIGAHGDVASDEVLDLLSNLVEKSLVAVD